MKQNIGSKFYIKSMPLMNLRTSALSINAELFAENLLHLLLQPKAKRIDFHILKLVLKYSFNVIFDDNR